MLFEFLEDIVLGFISSIINLDGSSAFFDARMLEKNQSPSSQHAEKLK